MTAFERALSFVLEMEGGWASIAGDRGGLTRYGLSSRAHPDIDLDTLTPEGAKAVYYESYWLPLRGDDLPPKLALLLFDWGVHAGVARASRQLQARLPVQADGIIGPKTLQAVWNANQRRLCLDLLRDRGDSLVLLGLTSGQGQFLKGWIRRLVALAGEVT